jgi:hypothetical protein
MAVGAVISRLLLKGAGKKLLKEGGKKAISRVKKGSTLRPRKKDIDVRQFLEPSPHKIDWSEEELFDHEAFNKLVKETDELVERATPIKPRPTTPDKVAEYTLNERQTKHSTYDIENIETIEMDPLEFLKLTTRGNADINHILKTAKPLSYYNSPKVQKGSSVHPNISIEPDGQIVGHEGRHRAAAVYNAGGKKFKVAVGASGEGYANKGYGWKGQRKLSLPEFLKGQFKKLKYNTQE